jgi:hypothetical protein
MSFWKPKKLFKAKVPDLKSFIGRNVTIDGKKIKIHKIVGNVGLTLGRAAKDVKPTFYEINDEYLIGMLRFHAQMEGDTSITEEEFLAFENMEFDAERLPDKPKEKIFK